MTSIEITGDALWKRLERAVEKVQARLRRTVGILERAGLSYAIVGDQAASCWVAQVDEAAVRTTRDVDILIRRADLEKAIVAMEGEGFVFRHSAGISMFLEGPEGKARDAVHIVFSGEMVRDDDPEANPEPEPFEIAEDFRTLPLETLVRMKLNSNRLKDRVHIVDMIDVGLIDTSWLSRFSGVLQERLKHLLENPDG